MKRIQEPLRQEGETKESVLHLAFEMSMSKWKMAFGWGEQARYVTMARDLDRLQEEIGKAKKRFKVPEGIRILSCYEAGRDGFWLHLYLRSCGVENLVMDSSSIEVSRRKRRSKTDRLDARKLLGMLVRHSGGERGFWSVVKVPGVEEEEARHLHRELEVLWKERTMHRNRIQSLLILQGIGVRNPSGRKFLVELESVRTWDGRKLSGEVKARIIREHGRLRMVEEQIYGWKKEQEMRPPHGKTPSGPPRRSDSYQKEGPGHRENIGAGSSGSEDEMPLGNLLEHVGTEPFPEFHHPLLMAGRTEMTALAGKSQKIFMVAISALHPGKAVVQVATFKVAVNDLLEIGLNPCIIRNRIIVKIFTARFNHGRDKGAFKGLRQIISPWRLHRHPKLNP